MARLILASASPVRARLLSAAGVFFEVVPACIDEKAIRLSLLEKGREADEIADILAEAKAHSVSAMNSDAFVLGADQILCVGGEIIGKSESIAEAAILLRRLRGCSHRLISSLVLVKQDSAIWRYAEAATLWMRDFSDEFLNVYLRDEGQRVLGSVGCYRLEGRGMQLFSRIDGDYFTILGLPLLPLLSKLREYGVLAR